MKIQYIDYHNWTIHLKCGVSLLSWGENIVIRIFSGMDGGTELLIYSESTLATTLVDWGKNAQNIAKIAGYVGGNFTNRIIY